MTKPRNKKLLKVWKLNFWPIILIAVLIAIQTVSIVYMFKLRESVLSLEDRYFLSYVNQVEAQRYKRAVVDVSKQKIYIPDAGIYIPLTGKDPQIMYDSRRLENTSSKIVYLTVAQAVGNQRSLDDSVDNHSCDKMIMISSLKLPGEYTFIKEITATKDGLRYVYLHPRDNCSIYSQSGWESAKNIAENIRNY